MRAARSSCTHTHLVPGEPLVERDRDSREDSGTVGAGMIEGTQSVEYSI
jgi:hypothetical protein